jgi:N-acetyl-alpha-D-muramate 1-phosphate uridylyltransferase
MSNVMNPPSGVRGMILAAGLGTRLKPWTDHHPKALAVVNGKSLLQRNIEYLHQFGINEVIVNVHHLAEQIRAAIEENKGWGSNITISDETSEVLETGGGLKKAAWYFKEEKDLVLMNVDILTDLNLAAMIQQHQNTDAIATLAVTERTTSRYFLFNAKNELCGWRNVSSGEEKIVKESLELQQKAFSGIHVISTRLLSLLSKEGKFSMVDVYLDIAKDHFVQGFDHSDSKFIDVGKPESVEKAEKLFE